MAPRTSGIALRKKPWGNKTPGMANVVGDPPSKPKKIIYYSFVTVKAWILFKVADFFKLTGFVVGMIVPNVGF